MPNRLLREGMLDSDAIGSVSPGAEMLFVRLMLLADDFGRYDGRVSVICRRAFVNRRAIDEHMTGEWLQELIDSGLVLCYFDAGRKPFVQIVNFRQRTRAQSSKYPSPEACHKQNQQLSVKNDGHSSVIRLTDDGPRRTETETETEEYPLTPLQGASVGGAAPGDSAQDSEAVFNPDSSGPTGGDRNGTSPVDTAAHGAGAGSPRRRGKAPPVAIKAWLKACAEAGEKPIPADGAAMAYAQQAGIPFEFVAMHWREFKTRMVETDKRYRDWRATFLNSLRGNWYGIWVLHADGGCNLTTRGVQAQKVQAAMLAEGEGSRAAAPLAGAAE